MHYLIAEIIEVKNKIHKFHLKLEEEENLS